MKNIEKKIKKLTIDIFYIIHSHFYHSGQLFCDPYVYGLRLQFKYISIIKRINDNILSGQHFVDLSLVQLVIQIFNVRALKNIRNLHYL